VHKAAWRLRAALVDRVIRSAGVRQRLDPAEAEVALTFDDGPDPDQTPPMLDELARLGIVATFFLVGHRARAHPGIVRRMLDEGHAIGSHSRSHPDPWRVPLRTLVREYHRGRHEVELAARQPVPLFRPPKGYVNGAGAVAMLAARVRPWLWTLDPGDWKPDAAPDEIVDGLSTLCAGDVVLLHDAIEGPLAPSALDRSATRAALPGIAGLARERRLGFTTLS
jgi:peptidoglycan/xylan/chitin deacetylase (PgdA/CDA1 family)